MARVRWALLVLVLSLPGTSGCFVTSAQVGTDYVLPSPLSINGLTPVVPVPVDLNTVPDYSKYRDKMRDVLDVAILGTFLNNPGGPACGVELWMTPGPTTYLSAVEVRANGLKLWGPCDLAPGEASRRSWDESATLFDPAGRAALVQEARGDGRFTVYLVPTKSGADLTIRSAVIALVLDVGV